MSAQAREVWSKDTPERREGILQSLREGHSLTIAAGLNGISRDTLYAWRKADPVFADECEAAASQGLAEIESAVATMAKTDLNAAKFVLERRKHVRDEYQPAQHNPSIAIQQIFNPLGQLAPLRAGPGQGQIGTDAIEAELVEHKP